jgi:nucleoid DNA-binding protein
MADSLSLRDLANDLADDLGVSKAAAYEAATELFSKISKAALSGGRVAVHGFGTFSLKERKARTGRNPQTGASIKIAASKTVGFKPGSALKKKGGKK